MNLTPNEQITDIEQMLTKIKDIITSGDLPTGLAGDLLSQSLLDRYDRLSAQLAQLQRY